MLFSVVVRDAQVGPAVSRCHFASIRPMTVKRTVVYRTIILLDKQTYKTSRVYNALSGEIWVRCTVRLRHLCDCSTGVGYQHQQQHDKFKPTSKLHNYPPPPHKPLSHPLHPNLPLHHRNQRQVHLPPRAFPIPRHSEGPNSRQPHSQSWRITSQ